MWSTNKLVTQQGNYLEHFSEIVIMYLVLIRLSRIIQTNDCKVRVRENLSINCIFVSGVLQGHLKLTKSR